LRKVSDDMTCERNKLIDLVQQRSVEIEELKKCELSSQKQLSDLNERAAAETNRCAQLTAELSDFKSEFASFETGQKDIELKLQTRIAELEHQVTTLITDRDALADSLSVTANELNESRSRLSVLELDSEKSIELLDTELKTSKDELNSLVMSAERERSEMEFKLASVLDEREQLLVNNAALKLEYDEFKSNHDAVIREKSEENEQLKSQLNTSLSECDSLARQLDEITKSCDELRAQCSHIESTLGLRNDELTQEIQQRVEELADLRQKCLVSEDKIEELSQQLKLAFVSQEGNEKMRDELTRVSENLGRVLLERNQLEESNKTLSAELDLLRDKQVVLQENCLSLENEKKELQGSCLLLEENLSKEQAMHLLAEQEMEQLRAKLTAVNEETVSLREGFTSAETAKNDLMDQISKLNQTNMELEEKCAKALVEKEELNGMLTTMQSTVQENLQSAELARDELSVRAAAVNNELRLLQEHCTAIECEKKELEDKLVFIQDEKNQLASLLTGVKEEFAEFKEITGAEALQKAQDLENLNSQLSLAVAQHKSLDEEIQTVRTNCSELKAQFDETERMLQLKIEELNKDLDTTKTERDVLAQKLVTVEEENESLTKTQHELLSTLEKDNARLSDELQLERAGNEKHTLKYAELKAERDESVDALTRELQVLREEYERFTVGQKQQEQLAETLAELQQQRDKLAEDLAAARSEVEQLQTNAQDELKLVLAERDRLTEELEKAAVQNAKLEACVLQRKFSEQVQEPQVMTEERNNLIHKQSKAEEELYSLEQSRGAMHTGDALIGDGKVSAAGEDQMSVTERDYQTKVACLQEEIASLKSDNTALNDSNSSLQVEKRELENKLIALQQEWQQLTASLESTEKGNLELLNKLATLQSENNQLRKLKAEDINCSRALKTENGALEKLRSELELVTEENQRLTMELSAVKSSFEKMDVCQQEMKLSYEECITALKADLQDSISKTDELTKQLMRAENEASLLQESLNDDRASKQLAESGREALEVECAELRKELERLMSQSDRPQFEIDLLGQPADGAEETQMRVNKLLQERELLLTENVRLKDELDGLRKTVDEIKSERVAAEEEWKSSENELETLIGKMLTNLEAARMENIQVKEDANRVTALLGGLKVVEQELDKSPKQSTELAGDQNALMASSGKAREDDEVKSVVTAELNAKQEMLGPEEVVEQKSSEVNELALSPADAQEKQVHTQPQFEELVLRPSATNTEESATSTEYVAVAERRELTEDVRTVGSLDLAVYDAREQCLVNNDMPGDEFCEIPLPKVGTSDDDEQSDVAELRQQCLVEQLRVKPAAVESEVSSLTEQYEKRVAELNSQIMTLQTELESVRTDLETARQEHVAVIESERQQASDVSRCVEQKLVEDLAREQAKTSAVEERLSACCEELAQCKAALAQSLTKLSELTDERNRLEGDFNENSKLQEALNERITALNEENLQLKAEAEFMSSNLSAEESPALVENESEVERLNLLVTSLRSELLLAAEENEREQVRANSSPSRRRPHFSESDSVGCISPSGDVSDELLREREQHATEMKVLEYRLQDAHKREISQLRAKIESELDSQFEEKRVASEEKYKKETEQFRKDMESKFLEEYQNVSNDVFHSYSFYTMYRLLYCHVLGSCLALPCM
jgi:chromosome segregation ATPase